MKKKQISISIPQPCSENWEAMTPNERGRHCDSCNKTIVDFSLFSDKQLVDFFASVKGTVCGRIANVQTARVISYTEPQNHFLYKLLFGSVLTIGIAGSANANYISGQKPLIEQYIGVHESDKQPVPTDSIHHYIEGTLTDSTNKDSLPFACVMLTHNGVKIDTTYTDINGYYKLHIPDSLQGATLILTASYLGYGNHKQEFKPSQLKNPLNIQLKGEAVLKTMGIMVITKEPPFDYSSGWDKQTLHPNDTPYK